MLKKCRICNSTYLISCINLGDQYLSSIFPDSLDYKKKLKKYPLELMLCKECGFLQLDSQPDMKKMYQYYPYTSFSNESMRKVLEDVAKSGLKLGHLKKGDLILDIGGNDGTLLSFFKGRGYELLNIDPANITPIFFDAIFIKDFFTKEVFQDDSDKKASLIFSIAMFYHLSDPIKFCKDVEECLADNGVFIIQMAYLPLMLKTFMYDNIVHEHLGYYTIEIIQRIMNQVGLEVFDVELNNVYGGSFRVFIKKQGCIKFKKTKRLKYLLKKEKQSNLSNLKTYVDFNNRIQKTKVDLLNLLNKLKTKGKTIWVYGASTKGNTILQYCDITTNLIDAAGDSNPFKFKKYMIGSDIPIKTELEMRETKPNYLLALPYSFIKNFIIRETKLIYQGTKFIVPLPEVRIL